MQKTKPKWSRQARNNVLLLLPVIILILTLSLYPLLRGVYLGFTGYKVGKGIHFNGLDNYVYLTQSGYFWPSLGRQAYITLGSMAITYICGLLLALALNSDIPFRRFFRVLIIVPWAIPPLVKVAIWENVFSSNTGWLNYLLKTFGLIDQYQVWIGDPNRAIYCVMVMIAWGCIPYLTLMTLSTLQSIPGEYYEAARIDGSSPFQELICITLPHLKQVMIVTSSFLFIWIAGDFTSQFQLTGGGPGSSTLTLIVEAYRQGFERGNFGLACSYGNLMTCFMGAFMIIYLKLVNRKEAA